MKKVILFALILSTVFTFALVPKALALGEESGNNPGEESGQNPGEESGTNRPDVSITIENPLKVGDTLFELAEAVVNNIILPIGGVLCVLAFIYSGFKYVMARGDSKKIEEASKALLYTAIGTALLLGAWLFANVIRSTINQLI